MSNLARKALSIAALGVALAGLAGTASADTAWQTAHPRREQVNDRLANQNRRIHQDVKNGALTKGQAAALHRDDQRIRRQERAMAGRNGGHISKTEQNALNRRENAVSRSIPLK